MRWRDCKTFGRCSQFVCVTLHYSGSFARLVMFRELGFVASTRVIFPFSGCLSLTSLPDLRAPVMDHRCSCLFFPNDRYGRMRGWGDGRLNRYWEKIYISISNPSGNHFLPAFVNNNFLCRYSLSINEEHYKSTWKVVYRGNRSYSSLRSWLVYIILM